jgi:hypothetical protein
MDNQMVKDIGRQIEQSEAMAVLISKKMDLLRSLLEVESAIAILSSAGAEVKEAAPAQAAVEAAPSESSSLSADSRRRGRKPKGELSLSNLILQIVSSNESGLTMSEIATQLFQNGYKTTAAEPARLISATLSTMKCKGLLHKNESNRFFVKL